jgi:hypothetical protein
MLWAFHGKKRETTDLLKAFRRAVLSSSAPRGSIGGKSLTAQKGSEIHAGEIAFIAVVYQTTRRLTRIASE